MRNVRIATASFLIEDTPHTIAENFEQAEELIQEAGEQEADILCLPETVLTNNVEGGHMPEDFPGAYSGRFCDLARQNDLHLIAPFYVRTALGVYNRAILIDNLGQIVGWYDKLQPTGWEARFVTPGDKLPVFDLEFGRVAIMICMDIYFPEIARIYAMKGAELLFWPTTTHGPTQQGLEAQLRSRAIDNSLTIIESNLAGEPPYAPYANKFYPGNARIIDHNGDFIAQTGRRAGLAIADIDLDERRQTQGCFLITDPDDTRRDLESLVRLDLYAEEFAALAQTQHRFYDTIERDND
jgi:5-aminopentanamidase